MILKGKRMILPLHNKKRNKNLSFLKTKLASSKPLVPTLIVFSKMVTILQRWSSKVEKMNKSSVIKYLLAVAEVS